MNTPTIKQRDYTAWSLRIGLAIVFSYAGISSLLYPLEWAAFLPHLLTSFIAAPTLVILFAMYELLLVAWLLSGLFTRYAALLCALTLAGIVVVDPSQLIITFRDIGLAFMAVALFCSDLPTRKNVTK